VRREASGPARTKPTTTTGTVLRDFQRPRVWLALWAAMILAVIVGSLLPARELPPMPFDNFDKVEHLLGYAVLSAYAAMLFARMRAQALAAAGLVALGIGIELAQAALTASRQADPVDAMVNTLGVLAGLALVLRSPRWACLLQRFDARLP
jgi:VanZ family protein